ncbi:MAG: hypothetical protein NTV30_06520, partial [Chloroflexi bacterium]|nr:hypothetical protein [Chloroflexota bacterium]
CRQYLGSVIEILLIAGLSSIGSYAFYKSALFGITREALISIYPDMSNHLTMSIWLILFFVGFLTMTVLEKGSGIFTWLVLLVSIPSLLVFNMVNWPEIFGIDYKLKTQLNFYTTFTLGILIMAGYIILNYIHEYKKTNLNHLKSKANNADMEKASYYSHRTIVLATSLALVLIILTILLARGFQLIVQGQLQKSPWWAIVSVSAICIITIGFLINWLGSRHKPKE